MKNIQNLFGYLPYAIDVNLNKEEAKVWYKSEVITKQDEDGNLIPFLQVGVDNFKDVPAAYCDLSEYVSFYMNAESDSEAEQIQRSIACDILKTIKEDYVKIVEQSTKDRDEQAEIEKDAKLIYNGLQRLFADLGITVTSKHLYHTEYGIVTAMDFYDAPSADQCDFRLTIHFDSAGPDYNAQIRLKNIIFSDKYRGKGFSKEIINLLFFACANSGHHISLFIEDIVNPEWENYLTANGAIVVRNTHLGNTVRIKNFLP